jgi:arylsulfatase A-like enzyme
MIVRVPGVTKGGSSKALVEMVDLFPTLAALCGVTPPSNLQGRSFVPLLKDSAAAGKEYAYTVVKRGEQLGRAIRFEHWRYTEWGSPDRAELYDLDADPKEFTNLVGNKDHTAVLARAKALLAKAGQHAKGQAIPNPKGS